MQTEKIAVVGKTSVGLLGTLITIEEMQLLVGIATLIFMILQSIVLIINNWEAIRKWLHDRFGLFKDKSNHVSISPFMRELQEAKRKAQQLQEKRKWWHKWKRK